MPHDDYYYDPGYSPGTGDDLANGGRAHRRFQPLASVHADAPTPIAPPRLARKQRVPDAKPDESGEVPDARAPATKADRPVRRDLQLVRRIVLRDPLDSVKGPW